MIALDYFDNYLFLLIYFGEEFASLYGWYWRVFWKDNIHHISAKFLIEFLDSEFYLSKDRLLWLNNVFNFSLTIL